MIQVIGSRFEIHEMIGQGGMGEVYRGIDTQTGEMVAIKSLKSEVVVRHPKMLERFEREADALRRLNHPNIVKVLTSVDEGKHHYLIMEYVKGGSLWDLMEAQGQLPVQQVVEIALDLADALTRAHRLKIIHRDMKPHNVLLSEDGTPRLSDFGVAHIGDRTRMTNSGVLVGTYSYLSPEACMGQKIDERADIWSFGVMLFEMLAGVRPYNENQPAAILIAIMSQPVPDLLALRPDVPPALASLIHRMLAKDPDERIASVRLVGAELEAILANRTFSATPPAMPVLFAPSESRFATPTASQLTLPRWLTPNPSASDTSLPVAPPAQRFSPAYLAGFLLLLLMVSAGIFLLTQNKDKNEDTSSEVVIVEPVATDKYMVLVADFESLGSTEMDVTRFIIDELTQTLEREVPFAEVQIRQYPQVITSADAAAAAAEANQAPIVIWGNYTDELIEVELQIGSLAAFSDEIISRETLARTANIRLHMTDARRESIAPYVASTLLTLQASTGRGYETSRAAIVLDTIEVEAAVPANQTLATFYHQAVLLFVSDPAASHTQIRKAIDLDAGNPLLYAVESWINIRLDNLNAAQASLNTLQRLIGDKQWAYAYFLGGNLDMQRGDLATAVTKYDVLVELRPDDWFVWNFRAALHYLTGNYEQAKADYAKVFELEPEMNFPFSFTALLALREGRISDTQQEINTVITQFPDPAYSMRMTTAAFGSPDKNIFGPGVATFMYMAFGRFEDTIAAADLGLKLMPMSELHMAKGFAYCNLGDYEKSLASFSEAIEIDPDFVLLYLLRASIYLKQNQLALALTDFQTAREIGLPGEMATIAEDGIAGNLDCTNFFTFTLN